MKFRSFCVGHSLGAQVCGQVGKSFGPKLDGIIASDPAGPIFESNSPENKLQKEDAKVSQGS